MLKGTVIFNEEPEYFRKKYNGYTNQTGGTSENYPNGSSYGGHRTPIYPLTNQPMREQELRQILNSPKGKEIKVGTRVKRTNGNGGFGTVLAIHNTVVMAWSYDDGVFKPFRVEWDDGKPTKYGRIISFDYAIGDIYVPINGENNETIPNLPVAC